ncbi:MAG: HipA domain-containing protein [Motiliproteus sp.]
MGCYTPLTRCTRMSDSLNRVLAVWNNHTLIGELRESNNLWQFEYDPQWTDFDLCPSLPIGTRQMIDGASLRPVQWFFDNLLPEGGARELISRDAKINKADSFGLLLEFGAESAGALTLLPPGERPGTGITRPFTHEALSESIRNLPNFPLTAGTHKKMSLAGAQHKLPVIFEDCQLYAPDESYPSSHILKPDHPDTNKYEHTAANEWFVMRLAEALKLSVPPVDLLSVPESVYLIERFDRSKVTGSPKRIHAIDACQVLSIDRIFKYRECNADTLDRLITLTRSRAETRQRLFCWLLFNILVGNNDDHLKNLSFFPDGDRLVLTDHYDLLSTTVYAPNDGWELEQTTWPVGQAQNYSQIDINCIHQLAQSLKVPKSYVDRTIKRYCSQICALADSLIAEHSASDQPGLAKAGQQRLLRKIRYGVINDMVGQLT